MTPIQMQKSSLLSILIKFLYIVVVSCQYDKFSKMELPPGVTGPESVEFGTLSFGVGPYTTVTDGRILKWLGPNIGFVDFAYTAPTRTKQLCDGTTDEDLGPICGRPMALSFQPTTGLLYIADAYFGLLVVGPLGGLATQLSSGYNFVTSVDADPITGNVYFTGASLTSEIRNTSLAFLLPALISNSDRIITLLNGIRGALGSICVDRTFPLIADFNSGQILKYWLVGPKANTAEILTTNVGSSPGQIKRAGRSGEFWVALSVGFQPPTPLTTPQGVRFNSDGVMLQRVLFDKQFFNKTISVVREENGKLFVGSRLTDFIGVYSN